MLKTEENVPGRERCLSTFWVKESLGPGLDRGVSELVKEKQGWLKPCFMSR